MRLALRERLLMAMQLVQTIIMALLIGAVYYKIPFNAASLDRFVCFSFLFFPQCRVPHGTYLFSTKSALFFCAINQGIFGALMTINTFPAERVVSWLFVYL